MGLSDKLKDFFSFTPAEKRIFFIIALLFIVGSVFKIFNGTIFKTAQPTFDYRQSDSIFNARSNSLQGNFNNNPSQQKSKVDNLGNKKININKATKSQLMTLPGIGETTAEKIIHYRENEGKFKRVEDLLKVKGIGVKKLEKLKPFLLLN